VLRIIAFWDIAPSIIIEADRRFRVVYCLHNQGEDGSSTHLRKTKQKQNTVRVTALYSRSSVKKGNIVHLEVLSCSHGIEEVLPVSEENAHVST
jgi:hypothetical protein